MRVRVGSFLHSFVGGSTYLEAEGGTLGDLLDELERRFPGLRARILDDTGAFRPLVSVFVGEKSVCDLDHGLRDGDTVHILGAGSGD